MKAGLLLEFYLRALDYHTRSGLRLWCNCQFCQNKLAGTRYIGHNTFRPRDHFYDLEFKDQSTPKFFPGHLVARVNDGPYWQDSWEDYVRYGIERERERKRLLLRAELRELKEKAL